MDSNSQITSKEQVKNLWEECFDDSPVFTDFYFEKRYSDDINISINEDGRIVSALQMIPYPMTVMGNIIPTSYISGACTTHDFRNKGLMRRLLRLTHERMFSEGVVLSTLIPGEEWLVGFYEKSGYTRCFSYENRVLKMDNSKGSPDVEISLTLNFSDEIYNYFDNEMKKRDACIQHSQDDFKVIMKDLEIEEGNLYNARKDGKIKGLAFIVTYMSKVYLKELISDDDIIEQSLVNAICKDYNIDELTLAVPSIDCPIQRGMARVINVKAMLDLYAKKYKDREMYIKVIDEDISSNNGFYNIFLGECDCDVVDGKEYKKYSIKELTSMLLYSEYPFMSLMLD